MSDESGESDLSYEHTMKPGDRLIHRSTRRSRLAVIERGVPTPFHDGYHILAEILTQTPVLWFLGALIPLVFIGPIPRLAVRADRGES